MVTVYPNPVVDKVYVVGDVTSCEIYDLVGKRVKSISTNMEEIRVSDLQSGIYMMQFLTKNGNVVTKKIVKQ
jgi:bifunctional DNase/RNase